MRRPSNAGPVTVFRNAAESQPHFGGGGRLARVAAAEDDVFHPLAAQALGALLAHHPGDGVGDVALAAAVRTDDRGHALVEGELRPIGEGLEAVDFQTFQTHAIHHCAEVGARAEWRDRLSLTARRIRAGQRPCDSGWDAERQQTDSAALSPSDSGRRPRGRETVVSVTRPSYRGKRKLRPKCIVVARSTYACSYAALSAPAVPCVELPCSFCASPNIASASLRLRIDPDQVTPRVGDAEHRLVDLEADHRPDEVEILLERVFVDLRTGRRSSCSRKSATIASSTTKFGLTIFAARRLPARRGCRLRPMNFCA